jgi:hypothetical protein
MIQQASKLRLTEDWEFNVIGIYNIRKTGHFKPMFDYIKKHANEVEGDIVDVGVFRGFTTLGFAIFLKEIGSDKKVYGYDSFKGFPPNYNSKDDFARYEECFNDGQISQEYWDEVRYYWETMKFLRQGQELNHFNVSTSSDFSNTSKEMLEAKIERLGLDNIVLIDGYFSETMGKVLALTKLWPLIWIVIYMMVMDTFNFIWDRLSPKAYVWVDEYYSLKFPGARIATDEFWQTNRKSQKCTQELRVNLNAGTSLNGKPDILPKCSANQTQKALLRRTEI